jgi:hypothetical protein
VHPPAKARNTFHRIVSGDCECSPLNVVVACGVINQIRPTMGEKKQFAVGTAVSIKSSGATGVVILFEDTPTVLGEYWHTV